MERFLLNRDYQTLIRNEIRQILTGSNDYTQEDAEEVAQDLISSFLRDRYDTSKIFLQIPVYDQTATYLTDDLVKSHDDFIYRALIDTPGSDLSNTDDWNKEDPRSKIIVRAMIDITLYDLHSNISSRQIPDLRVKRYDETMSWLKKVQKGEVNPGFEDAILEGRESGDFRLGGNSKVSERW